MKTWSRHAIRTLTATTAAALIGLAATACQTGAQPAASAPPTSIQTALTTTAATAATAGQAVLTTTAVTTGRAVPTNTSSTRVLKFPNTNDDVVFTGYDEKNKLVEFQKVVQDPKSQGAHLIPDPSDPATHELPMTPGTDVKSIDPNGFPFETCPPISCTVDNIMESVIGHNNGAFYAHIHVNAADQIDSVRQSAY